MQTLARSLVLTSVLLCGVAAAKADDAGTDALQASDTLSTDATATDATHIGAEQLPASLPTQGGEAESGGEAHVASGRAGFGSGHAAEHAEGSGHAEHATFNKRSFVLQLLNFGVLLFLLIKFGGGAMSKSLRARHLHLKKEIGDAAQLRDGAKAKFTAQEARIANLEKEIASLRSSMQQEAEREQARMIESAQERARRIQEETRLQLAEQVRQAEQDLRQEVALASFKMAEEFVRKSVDTSDQRRLAQEFIAGLGESPTSGGTVP